jgi:hypothetical protein
MLFRDSTYTHQRLSIYLEQPFSLTSCNTKQLPLGFEDSFYAKGLSSQV